MVAPSELGKENETMKRAMAFAVALLAAAVTQAASFTWGGNVWNAASGDTASEGTIINLVYFGSETPGTATKYDIATGLTDAGGTLVESHTLTAAEASGYEFVASHVADASSINGNYMVVIYDPNTPDVFGSWTTSISGVTETSSGDTITEYSGDWKIGGTMGGTVINSAPEPCSVALLLLGAAAFGLKRKRA